MTSRRLCLLSLCWILCPLAAHGGVPIRDTELNFRLELPDGFQPAQPPPGQRDVLYFYKRPAVPGRPGVGVVITRLRGTLDRQDPTGAAKGKDGQPLWTSHERWKEFDVW